ncbi:MAG: YbhB/YbcL family Raf kinase inhibitor-like protein [Anaerolineales bacterium]|nr:YbhB/YbcL family Raf kinase inhibitor-like protein [Anaerolineales bacterium]
MSNTKKRFALVLTPILFITGFINACQPEAIITLVNTEPTPKPLEETKEVAKPMSEEIESPEPIQIPTEFILTSEGFLEGEPIPTLYTCNGDDVSPPLAWSGTPNDTSSFALIMDDPDAPMGWVHWVLFNLPGDAATLDVGLRPEAEAPAGSRQGTNSWGRLGYGGPCPPSGIHRYFFKLYALDISLALDESATKEDVLAAMEGHILSETALMGTYSASGD